MRTILAAVVLLMAACGGPDGETEAARHDTLAEAVVSADGTVSCQGADTQTATTVGERTYVNCAWNCAAWIDGAQMRHDGARVQIEVVLGDAQPIFLVSGSAGCR